MIDDEKARAVLREYDRLGRYIQGFHYPPYFVIRDFRLKDQNIWRGPDTTPHEVFQEQCQIEKMRRSLEKVFEPQETNPGDVPQGGL